MRVKQQEPKLASKSNSDDPGKDAVEARCCWGGEVDRVELELVERDLQPSDLYRQTPFSL